MAPALRVSPPVSNHLDLTTTGLFTLTSPLGTNSQSLTPAKLLRSARESERAKLAHDPELKQRGLWMCDCASAVRWISVLSCDGCWVLVVSLVASRECSSVKSGSERDCILHGTSSESLTPVSNHLTAHHDRSLHPDLAAWHQLHLSRRGCRRGRRGGGDGGYLGGRGRVTEVGGTGH